MKHLKRFENYDFGRFNSDDKEDMKDVDLTENEFANEVEDDFDDFYWDEEEEEEQEEETRRRRWGDEEIVEKKKINPGFQAFLDKQKAKKEKNDCKDCKEMDDKKDSSKKDKKEDDKKGLTAGQKKLPEALQKAILKKQKK